MDRDVCPDELAADLERQANDRAVTPREYHPPLETLVSTGYEGIFVIEKGSEPADGQYIHCENPVEARL